MPRCEGMPDGRWPDQRHDSSVKNGEGDLMLCARCDAERHRIWLESRQSVSETRSTSSTQAGSICCPVVDDDNV